MRQSTDGIDVLSGMLLSNDTSCTSNCISQVATEECGWGVGLWGMGIWGRGADDDHDNGLVWSATSAGTLSQRMQGEAAARPRHPLDCRVPFRLLACCCCSRASKLFSHSHAIWCGALARCVIFDICARYAPSIAYARIPSIGRGRDQDLLHLLGAAT